MWGVGAAMVPLGIVLTVERGSGSLAAAGAVLAAATFGSGLGAPITARWVDRVGLRRPVALLGLLQGTGLVVLTAGAAVAAPTVVLVAIAVLSGAIRPPVVPSLRTLLSRSFENDSERRSAYALLGLLQEFAFIVGPALVALLTAAFAPWAALLVAAAVVTVAAQRFARAPTPAANVTTARPPRLLRNFAVWAFTTLSLCSGVCFGALDVAAAAYSTDLAGAALAALAVGIALGAFGFGLRPPRGSAVRLLVPACALASAALALPALTPPGAVMVLSMLAVGLTLSPVLTLQSAAIDEVAARGSATQVGGFGLTAYAVGAPIGGLLAGAFADADGAAASFSVAVAALALATVVAFTLRLRRPTPPAAA